MDDFKVVAQLVVYAFGAGAVVQQLRNVNTNLKALEDRLVPLINHLTSRVDDHAERITSIEAWRQYLREGRPE